MKEVSQLILDLRDVGQSVASMGRDVGLLLQAEDSDDINVSAKVKHAKGLVENMLSVLTMLHSMDYNSFDRYEELSNEARKIEFSCFGLQSFMSQSLIDIKVLIKHKPEIENFVNILNMAANRIITISLITKYKAMGNTESIMEQESQCSRDNVVEGLCDKESACKDNYISMQKSDLLCDESEVCYKDRTSCEQACDGICLQDKRDSTEWSVCPEYSETFTESTLTHVENGYYEQDNELDLDLGNDVKSDVIKGNIEIINNFARGEDDANETDVLSKIDDVRETTINSEDRTVRHVFNKKVELAVGPEEETTSYEIFNNSFENTNDNHIISEVGNILILNENNDDLGRHKSESGLQDTPMNIEQTAEEFVETYIINEDSTIKEAPLEDIYGSTMETTSDGSDYNVYLSNDATLSETSTEQTLIDSETNTTPDYLTTTELQTDDYEKPSEYIKLANDEFTSPDYESSTEYAILPNEITTEPATSGYETNTEYASAYETTTELSAIDYEMNTACTTPTYETTTESTTPTYETTTQDLYKVSQDIYSAAQDLSTKANEISSITSDISSKVSTINSMVSDLNTYDDDELSKKIQSVSKITQEISSKTSEMSSLCSTTSSLASDISSASSDMPSADRYHRFKTSPWQKMSAKCQDMVTACQAIVTAAQDILFSLDSVVSHTADLKVADAVSTGVYDVTVKIQWVISETLNIVTAVIELMNVIEA